MARFERPTRKKQEEFLLHLYFGAGRDYLKLCIDKAYLDFSRTMHGINEISKPGAAHDAAVGLMRELFSEIKQPNRITDQRQFDEWHRKACDRLQQLYKWHDYDRFYVGQAQKWVNMTMKYIFVMGDERLDSYEHLYDLGHAPLDGVIVEQFKQHAPKQHSPPRLSCSWSRLRDYDEYFAYQNWIREAFADFPPLAVEFHLWQGEPAM